MEENKSHIDDVFRYGLSDYTEVPPPQSWEQLEPRLEQTGGTSFKLGKWVWYLSTVLLLVAGVYVATSLNKRKQQIKEALPVKTEMHSGTGYGMSSGTDVEESDPTPAIETEKESQPVGNDIKPATERKETVPATVPPNAKDAGKESVKESAESNNNTENKPAPAVAKNAAEKTGKAQKVNAAVKKPANEAVAPDVAIASEPVPQASTTTAGKPKQGVAKTKTSPASKAPKNSAAVPVVAQGSTTTPDVAEPAQSKAKPAQVSKTKKNAAPAPAEASDAAGSSALKETTAPVSGDEALANGSAATTKNKGKTSGSKASAAKAKSKIEHTGQVAAASSVAEGAPPVAKNTKAKTGTTPAKSATVAKNKPVAGTGAAKTTQPSTAVKTLANETKALPAPQKQQQEQVKAAPVLPYDYTVKALQAGMFTLGKPMVMGKSPFPTVAVPAMSIAADKPAKINPYIIIPDADSEAHDALDITPSDKKPLNAGKKWSVGVNAAYAKGLGANGMSKLSVNPTVQMKFSPKWSATFMPGVTYCSSPLSTLQDKAPYHSITSENLDSIVYVDTITMNVIRYYNYKQQYQDVGISQTVSRRAWEIELPVLVNYQVVKRFSLSAGMVATFGKVVTIQQSSEIINSGTYTDSMLYSSVSRDMQYFRDRQNTAGLPGLGSYNGSLYQNATNNPVRIGYMLGVSYEPVNRLKINMFLQQNISGTSQIPNPDVRKIYTMPYLRVGLGYLIF